MDHHSDYLTNYVVTDGKHKVSTGTIFVRGSNYNMITNVSKRLTCYPSAKPSSQFPCKPSRNAEDAPSAASSSSVIESDNGVVAALGFAACRELGEATVPILPDAV